MKISTAIALGRHLIKPRAGVHLNMSSRSGCAWGMVNVSAPSNYLQLLYMARRMPKELPCECRNEQRAIGGGMLSLPISAFTNFADAIVHLFNDHVMTRKDWTMDQLIDWVAANEPPDPEEAVTEHDSEEQPQTLVRA